MRYKARWVYWENAWRKNASVEIDHDAARIVGLAEGHDRDLGNTAMLPGLINTHSHAFQRAIRGRTEYTLGAKLEEDFWTWRNLMYEAALTFGPLDIYRVSRLAFDEMVASGITAVAEFHYVHHTPDGRPYDDVNELAHQVVRAALDAGLRVLILPVAYQRGGFGKPAESGQRRFIFPTVDAYLRAVDDLRSRYHAHPRVSVGVAPHSIRAVDRDWLKAIQAYALEHDLPLHMHACEQRREIEESIAEYGRPPMAVFADLGMLGPRTTLVHATHLTSLELELLKEFRPTIAACPTTERNLGDGFLPASELVARGVPISLGTDSQATINLFEDMRLVEYHERLRAERRNVLATTVGRQTGAARIGVGEVLFPMGTRHGARSLGIAAGELAAGNLADVMLVDLDHPVMRCDPGPDYEASLLDHITLSTDLRAVRPL